MARLTAFLLAASLALISRFSLADSGRLPGVWTAGPTRLVFTKNSSPGDASPRWYAYEQFGTVGAWRDTTAVPASTSTGDYASPVVIKAVTGNWEVHLFYARDAGSGRTVVSHARRDQTGIWGADSIAGMPTGVSLATGPAAVSNVYNAANNLLPQGSTPKMAVYFLGDDHNLWGTSYNNGTWATSWKNLGPGAGGSITRGQLDVIAAFDNGAFTTSVWIADNNGNLSRNIGAFDSGSRQWTFGWTSGAPTADSPAGVAWYDSGQVGNPNFAHTRVVVPRIFPLSNEANAAYIEPGGITGTDFLDRPIGFEISAGIALADCGGCLNPASIYRVVAFGPNYPPEIAWMDKGSGNLSEVFVDQWNTLPATPQPAVDVVRIPFGAGLGPIYAMGESFSHLFEYSSFSNVWVDHGEPALRPMINGPGQVDQLQGIALDHYGSIYLEASYNPDTGVWSDGASAFAVGSYVATAAAKEAGSSAHLYVFGVDAVSRKAAIAAIQDRGGSWSAGITVPNQAAAVSALVAGRGNTGTIQVVGLGKSDGRAYLSIKQNSSGTWSAGAQLPGQTKKMTALAMGASSTGALQVIGLGSDNNAYLVGRQDSSGNWQAGMLLPGSTPNLTAIALGNGNSNFLQVIGLTVTGSVVLVSWQDAGGNWNTGGQLSAPVAMSQIAVAKDVLGNLQVMGLGATDGLAYQAAWQDGSVWQPGILIPSTGDSLINLSILRAGDGRLEFVGYSGDFRYHHVAGQDFQGRWGAGAGAIP